MTRSKVRWTEVVIRRDRIQFPAMCPGCLAIRPRPLERVRLRTEKGKLTAFYVVGSRWEHLYVDVPFCAECSTRRKRWERYDMALLFGATLLSFVLAGLTAAWLNLPVWAFWVVFLAAASILTLLFNRVVRDDRGVRLQAHDDNSVRFAFLHVEYATEFARLNSRVGIVDASDR